jgi:hypothetical protein
MICAAKKDEKEMFAQLVQNATEVKYLPDDFIISSIDEESSAESLQSTAYCFR